MSNNTQSHASFNLLKLLPNIVTLIALLFGLTAIRYSLESKFQAAIIAILIAALLDALDGRLARLLSASSNFGAELDSLVDFINFGIAPIFIIYIKIFQNDNLQNLGWIALLIYTISAAIRLARFNTDIENKEHKEFYKFYFYGVPAPIGALLILMPLIVNMDLFPNYIDSNTKIYIIIYIISIAYLLSSRIPTFSFKSLSIKPEYVWLVLIVTASIAIMLLYYPWHVLPILAVLYLLLIPVGLYYKNKFL